MKINVLTLLVILGFPFLGKAQIIIPIDTTLEQFVVTNLIGSKQNVSNVHGNYDRSIGVFDFSETELGLDNGVVLSTGLVVGAVGPNRTGGMGFELGLGSDSTLAATLDTTVALYDATSIEFDFVPFTNEINFKYVFASEEYPEYVNSQFNDVFGFFVSGPGIDGVKNIALLPDGNPVAINNVNHLTNSQWYQNNSPMGPIAPVDTAHIQYDGFTVPLTASIEVTPFQAYHIKLVIADALDGGWDSAFFLKAKSFRSKPLVFDFDATEGEYQQTIFEDTKFLEISAKLPQPAKQDITYHFTYSGDAEMGQDYLAPASFTFKQGDTLASFKIQPIADDIVEGNETILLVIDETQDTLSITIDEHSLVPVTEFAEAAPFVYPNPAYGSFAVSSDLEVTSVMIYTLAGKSVKTFNANFQDMNIEDLPKGIYAVHIATKDGQLVQSLKVE